MNIVIINGPNLNLVGKRETTVYGEKSFGQYLEELKSKFPEVNIDYFQSNVEGELINKLHESGFSCDGIILNAGAYTHTSIAIGDAVKAIIVPVVEVHITNVMSREEFRHRSYISAGARGVIFGFGMDSYRMALLSFLGE